MRVTTSAAVAVTPDERAMAIVRAIADDLDVLAILHDREPTADLLTALHASPIAEQLTLRLTTQEALAAIDAFVLAVGELPRFADAKALDQLAADYADVYLRHRYRAAPTESVWLSEDGLDRQGPMLSIRAQLRRHGVKLLDANLRTEDHLVSQLHFFAHLLASDAPGDGPKAAARFLDAHLLRWVHQFAGRLVQVSAPPFYAALAVLTVCYLDEARQHLAEITGIARAVPQPTGAPTTAGKAQQTCGDDLRYVPGIAPSW